jgi:DNA topoisomerase-1
LRALAILACTPLPEPMSERACKTQLVAAVRQVAAELRNTPAVCRQSYINPVVFSAWRGGRLPGELADTVTAVSPRRAEKLALTILRREARRAARP